MVATLHGKMHPDNFALMYIVHVVFPYIVCVFSSITGKNLLLQYEKHRIMLNYKKKNIWIYGLGQ